MTDIFCILSGLIRLFCPVLALIYWCRRTHAKVLPAFAALAVCFPVFMLGNAIRSGFDSGSPIWFYIQQGLLFGVLEEGIKFIMIRFVLTDFDDRRDAVTYGIGHSAYEELGAGLACFGLVGKGTSASTILLANLWAAIEGTAFCIAGCILIMYGIRNSCTRLMLPLAILFHAANSTILGIFIEPVAVPLAILLTTIEWVIACRCWKAMKIPELNDDETKSTSDN